MKTTHQAFTLIEVMISITIIGLLAAMVIPNYMSAREQTQRNICINNMRKINAIKNIISLEIGLASGDPISEAQIFDYMNGDISCPANGVYYYNDVGVLATCSLGTSRSHYFVE